MPNPIDVNALNAGTIATPTTGDNTQLPGLDGPYTYSNFIYPLNLGSIDNDGNSAGLDHYVLFYINQTTTSQYHTRQVQNGDTSGQLTTMEQATQQANQAYGNGNSGVAGGDAQGVSGLLSAGQVVQRPNTRVATVIALYMPPEIVTSYATKWADTSMLGADQAADVLTGQGNKSWTQSVMDLGKSLLGSVVEGIGSKINAETDMNIGGELARRARMAINPHLEVLFNGVGFRSFKFNFRLMAQREEEADNIYNIIKAFKFYAAPEIMEASGGRYFIYPGEFDIKFISNGQENPYINKISTCALTNIEVNYTSSGQWVAFRQHSGNLGAPPVSIMLSLTFMELEIITKKRILQGF